MRCEIPEVGRCCFCFPLRLGLIVWGYIKIIVDVLLLTFILLGVSVGARDADGWTTETVVFTIIYFTIVGSLVADVIFHVIFAVGAHNKDPKKMDLFSKFSIYIFVLYVLGLLLAIVYMLQEDHFFAFFFGFTVVTVSFCCIISQMYIMVLVRSEVKKLERGSNFEFVNQATENNMNAKLGMDGVVV